MASPECRHPRIELDAGRTGTGKSYLAGYELEQYAAGNKKPFAVLDYKPENHIGLAKLNNTNLIVIHPTTKALNWKKILKHHPRLVVVKGKGTPLDTINDIYTTIIQICYDTGGYHILLEEAHNLAGLHNTIEPIKQVVLEGRGAGISIQFVTPHIQDFSKTVYREAEVKIGKTITEQDISYFKGTIPNYETLNSQLKKHEFIQRDQEGNSRIVTAGKRITKHHG